MSSTIYFVEIEELEQEFYGQQFNEHDLVAVQRLSEVGPEAEIVCVFITEPIGAEFLDAHPRLRLIASRSSSVDHLDVAACDARGVAVCNVPHYGETTVAEHTFALILALARRLREVMSAPRTGRFSYSAVRSMELADKTLGIVGMGRIGQRVAALARGFQMHVIADDPGASPELAREFGVELVTFEELLARSDVISLHTTLSEATYHLINRESLARAKRGVLIINTARGALIDTGALREALDSGQVGGAGLDVLQDERVLRESVTSLIGADILRHLRSDALAQEARDAERVRELEELMLGSAVLARANVIFTPHVAFNSSEAVHRLAATTAENIRAFLDGQPQHLVTATGSISRG